jgi:hypothetical protein
MLQEDCWDVTCHGPNAASLSFYVTGNVEGEIKGHGRDVFTIVEEGSALARHIAQPPHEF